MTSRNEEPGSPPAGDDKRLVCGVCQRLLSGTYGSHAEAEQAADEHQRAEHPDVQEVVVVPVSTWLVEEEGAESVVDIATGAQQRLEDREDGGAVGG